MPLIIPSNSISAGGYVVDNSLRFNSGSSDYLNRTFSTPTNNKKWTWSAWIKKSKLTNTQVLFGVANEEIRYIADGGSSGLVDSLQLSISAGYYFRTNAVYRDTSAWYHIVVATDMTLATASQRIRVYVNGSEASTDGTYNSTQNADTLINSAIAHNIGRRTSGSLYFDGYQSEVCFIDGQQLAPSDFGEFDENSGIWKPIDVSGLTFGTNGFYLDFEDSAALGDDVSGNGNDFTVNNLTAIDQTTDTPTNNFATLNPLNNYWSEATFSEGNSVYTSNNTGDYYGVSTSTIGVSSGKWYFEAKNSTDSSGQGILGITSRNQTGRSTWLGSTTQAYGYYLSLCTKNLSEVLG
jgi:hypothetical protein